MSGSIEVLTPGFYTSIQDTGRDHWSAIGVPQSGALDAAAYQLANMLLNNKTSAAVLEMTLSGPSLRFNSDSRFVVTGGEIAIVLNDKKVAVGKVAFAKAGSTLKLGRITNGFRSYLAIKGGFQTPVVMGSRSMQSAITDAATIEKGSLLLIPKLSYFLGLKVVSTKVSVNYINETAITVLVGSEFELLSKENKELLIKNVFTVGKSHNRMALQLEERISQRLPSITTGVVQPGTVQLTPSGNLIILLADCQTTGGYPRILQVTKAGLNILAQKKTGDKIKLRITTISTMLTNHITK